MNVLLSILKFPPDFTGSGLRIEKMYSRLLTNGNIKNVFVLATTERLIEPAIEKRGNMEIFFIGRNKFISESSKLSHRLNKIIFVVKSSLILIWQYIKVHKKYDIVHTIDSSWLSTLIGWLAFFSRKPMVKEIILIDTDDPMIIKKSKKPLIREIFLFPFYSSKLIITISNQLKDICVKVGIPEKKIWSRLNPVYTENITPKTSIKTDYSHTKKVLFVGTLIQRKNIEFLLEAGFYLRGKVELVFAGPYESKEYYEKLTALALRLKEKTNNRIISNFIGWINDRNKLADLFVNSDLFWFASKKEGMGNVIIESLLYGTPVVTLPVCGIMNEIITSNEEGVILNENASPEEFAAYANQYLYEFKIDRTSLMGKARKRFDPCLVENKYLEYFSQLLKK